MSLDTAAGVSYWGKIRERETAQVLGTFGFLRWPWNYICFFLFGYLLYAIFALSVDVLILTCYTHSIDTISIYYSLHICSLLKLSFDRNFPLKPLGTQLKQNLE